MAEHFPVYVNGLLTEVKKRVNSDFSGLGLIFYSGAAEILPMHAMGDETMFRPQLPIKRTELIAETLSEISCLASPWHDGFHLIEICRFELTHVCQFVLPPALCIDRPSTGAIPLGARAIAAMAMSKLPSVFCSVQLRSNLTQRIFQDGRLIEI